MREQFRQLAYDAMRVGRAKLLLSRSLHYGSAGASPSQRFITTMRWQLPDQLAANRAAVEERIAVSVTITSE